MSRTWPQPLAARTLHAIGDTHIGAAILPQFDANRRAIVTADCARADVPQVTYRVQLGDATDNALSAEDTAVAAWLAGLGGTIVRTIGNHDTWNQRTPAQCATAWGLPAKDYAVDLGYALLVVLGFDDLEATYLTQMTWNSTTLNWLDGVLDAATKPVLIAAHAPLKNTVGMGMGTYQYNSTDPDFYANPDSGIRTVIAEHDVVKAWISGHTHSPVTAPYIVKAETIGTHTVAAINTSCLAYVGKDKADWTSPLCTAFVTTLDDRIQVRFRDHGAHQWVGCGSRRQRVATVTF